jgi:hypothetical protein
MVLAEKGRVLPKAPAKAPETAKSRALGKLRPAKKT